MKKLLLATLSISMAVITCTSANAGLLHGGAKGIKKGRKEAVGGTHKAVKSTLGGTAKGAKGVGKAVKTVL